jgi:glycosyltransferase involved in cell wall biosynthesis
MAQNKAKILFVIQQVTPGTHMDYVFEMARTLREERGLALELLLEKPSVTDVTGPWIHTQTMIWAPLRVLENFWYMVRARARGVTVFYVHYSFLSAITAGLVARLSGARVYYWNAGMPWLYTRSWREDWYQRVAYKLIHVLVTGADALRAGYSATYGLDTTQIQVISNWIDHTTIKLDGNRRLATRAGLGIGPTDTLLLFVHKLSKRKGADFLIPVMEQLANPHVHLVVAGSGPLHAEIVAAAKAKGLEGRVHLRGFVEREVVATLYEAADIFVMPSEEEGSPHSLIEALAYGVPAVVTDVGGVRETLGEALSPWVVPYGDVSALVASINRLLIKDTTYETVKQQARVQSTQFEKSRIVDMFVTLLRS